jgi:hypothetical protein
VLPIPQTYAVVGGLDKWWSEDSKQAVGNRDVTEPNDDRCATDSREREIYQL